MTVGPDALDARPAERTPPAPPARLVFLTAETFAPTVHGSQVADLLQVLARAGLPFDVVAFDTVLPRTLGSRAGRAQVRAIARALPGALVLRPTLPFEDRVGQPLARRLLGRLLPRVPTVIHARGLWAAQMAVQLAARRPELRVVYDVRGDYVAEHAFHVSGRGDARGPRVEGGRARILRAEREVCARADAILAVSAALRDVLDERHPGAGARTRVVPCSYDPEKFALRPELAAEVRGRLGLASRWVVGYAGSLVPYQLPDAVARAARIACDLRDDAHVLLVTPEVERGRALLERANVPRSRSTVLAAAHQDMPGYLNALDLGLLLRRRDPVNHVASPTKVAEYLACGAAVLGSSAVADYAELIASEGLGAVIGDPDDPAAVRAALAQAGGADRPTREHAARVARERLARDVFLPGYQQLYGDLARAALAAPG